eukprot:gi/632936233/ref/XP_007893056.1/ PREDICTED: protein KIAA2022 homolog [Callorhinchus milii]
MDDQQKKDLDAQDQDQSTVEPNGVDDEEPCGTGSTVKPYGGVDPVVGLPSATSQKESEPGHRVPPPPPVPTPKDSCVLDPPSPLRLADVSEHTSNDSSAHAISLTSCITKGASYLSVPEDFDKAPFTYMEPKGISSLAGDCLMQQSRTCLGCFIESKESVDAEPGISMKIGDMNRDCETCSVSDIGMSTGDGGRYGDQLLSDQLLSFTVHKSRTTDKRDVEKSDSESEDIAQKHYYEGLLLDKCNGEEALLANPSQDWAYFESFISESKIELLDLCSKNELSVNLFAEEEVDNYMFDDESTLSSDVCSLKIRYESFQDNVREKSNALQEEAQFNFFPNVIASCAAKKDGKSPAAAKRGSEAPPPPPPKPDEADAWEDTGERRSHFLEPGRSADDSGEFSDDSYGTESSYETVKAAGGREHVSGEEKPAGEEEDDDEWCPRKRRKSARREPPVIIKYIIINRFKGQKDMRVKVGKVDAARDSVRLTDDALRRYRRLAPLKEFWRQRQRERALASGERRRRRRLRAGGAESGDFPSHPAKRKSKQIADRHRSRRVRLQLAPSERVACSFHAAGARRRRPRPRGPKRVEAEGDEEEDRAASASATAGTRIPGGCLDGLPSAASSSPGSPPARSTYRGKGEGRAKERSRPLGRVKPKGGGKRNKMAASEGGGEGVTDASEMASGARSPGSLRADAAGTRVSEPCRQAEEEEAAAAAAESCAFHPAACCSHKPPPSCTTGGAAAATTVRVIPGGYLQTLLDSSDSIGPAGIAYFPDQNHHRPPPPPLPPTAMAVPKAHEAFAASRLGQACVMTSAPPPPTELERHEGADGSFQKLWCVKPPDLGAPVPQEAGGGYRAMGMEVVVVGGGVEVDDDDELSKTYSLPPGADYLPVDGGFGLAAGDAMAAPEEDDDGGGGGGGTGDGGLIGFASLSLKPPREDDGEEDMGEDFLAHCSPKLVIPQSVDEAAPLKESADLLDISNFTPDRFRQASLSEFSPPLTPDLSPGVTVVVAAAEEEEEEACAPGDPRKAFGGDGRPAAGRFLLNGDHFQFHTFDDEDPGELVGEGIAIFGKAADPVSPAPAKGPKGRKKGGSGRHAAGTANPAPKAAKKSRKPKGAGKGAEKNGGGGGGRGDAHAAPKGGKRPAHGKRSDFLSAEEGKTASETANGESQSLHVSPPGRGKRQQNGGGGWSSSKKSGPGWSEHGVPGPQLLLDDQREFEEPSNILSNIASGMAEVQRFMMASIEPVWEHGVSPAASAPGACHSLEANSLKWKTLNILAGTPSEVKRKPSCPAAAVTTMATPAVSAPAKTRRSTAKASSKNPSKVSPADPAGGRLNFVPGSTSSSSRAGAADRGSNPPAAAPGVPVHKKMYRHKATLKLSGDEKSKVKRAEQEQHRKEPCVTASLEKLRLGRSMKCCPRAEL